VAKESRDADTEEPPWRHATDGEDDAYACEDDALGCRSESAGQERVRKWQSDDVEDERRASGSCAQPETREDTEREPEHESAHDDRA
jgi:hypothetical protein